MRTLALLLTFTFWSPAVRASPPELRLADALRRAERESAESALARAPLAIAHAEVRSAKMLPNPTFVSSVARSEPIVTAALQLHLPILGQRGAHVRAAERAVDQTSAEVQASLWHLRHDVRIAYFTAARADEEVAIAEEVEQLARRVAEIARERFDVGTGTQLERDQAALVHTRAMQDISDRRAASHVARQELARLMGAENESIGTLADGLSTSGSMPSLEALVAQLADRHPELRALRDERIAALARAAASRADRRPFPTVELGGELLEPATCNGTSRCLGPRGGLSFDFPLFNLNGGPIERAEAEAQLAERKADATRLRIVAEVKNAYALWHAATVRARFFDAEYLPTALRVEAMAREGFSAGKTGLLPLLEATRSVLDARFGRTEAQFAVQAARAELEAASGVALDVP